MNYISPTKRYGRTMANAAKLFRELAFVVEDSPMEINNYMQHEAFKILRDDNTNSCLYKAKLYEVMAYGDVGVLFACPRPCLTGIMLRHIGNKLQQQYYFDAITQRNYRSFFAVTEPDYGSDIGSMKSSLTLSSTDSNIFLLNGVKWLFGNGACGEIGTVIAKTSNSILGINAVLLDTTKIPANRISRQPLKMAGLRAAQLAYVEFKDVRIHRSMLVGDHLPVVQRGMYGLLTTFNYMRVCIAAMAVGITQAFLDYVYDFNLLSLNHIELANKELDRIRILVFNAANQLDKNLGDALVASKAKIIATNFMENLIHTSVGTMENGVLVVHPWLAKVMRDSFALEYTDGTTDIQKKIITQSIWSTK